MPGQSEPPRPFPSGGDPLAAVRRRVEDPADVAEPRHARLRAAILDLLAAGVWGPGDKLPPETEFARASGLSLGTAQKALNVLARDGVLARRHGHGTFVTGGASQADRLIHFRFVGDRDAVIAPVYAEAIDRRVVAERGGWSDYLPEAMRFVRIRRRVNVAEEFDLISEFYVDAGRFGAVMDLPMQELHRVVLRTILAERFDTPTLAVDQRVYATRFSDEIGALLALPADRRFGLVLEVRSSTHGGLPFAFQNVFIPPDARPLKTLDPKLFGPA